MEQCDTSMPLLNVFCKKMPEFSQTTPLGNGDSVTIIKQMGKTGAFRSYRYGVEEPWFFYHLGENMIKAEFATIGRRLFSA